MKAKELSKRFHGTVARRYIRTGIRYGSQWLTQKGHLNILIPSNLAVIGSVRAIEYECIRDGKHVDARHPFAPGARPRLAVGSARGEVFLLGTSYKFTDLGFTDFDSHGRAIDYDEDTDQISLLDR